MITPKAKIHETYRNGSNPTRIRNRYTRDQNRDQYVHMQQTKNDRKTRNKRQERIQQECRTYTHEHGMNTWTKTKEKREHITDRMCATAEKITKQ